MILQTDAEAITADYMSGLTRADFDQLAFGVIELDREFRVRSYNQSESQLARRSVADTVGKDFFREVAPCTNDEDFRGRIAALMADDVAVESEARFDYTFAFAWGSRRVRVRALRATDSCWVFVTPLRSFDDR